ncbi:MAG: hypothetical protein LT106_18770 [Burkholderiaceae bacterium]|nr:hypothetical protein [Burkholderiaceae bacterium]
MRSALRYLGELAVVVFLVHSFPAHAQMLRVTFDAQAQMATASGALSGCGLLFSGAHVDDTLATGVQGSINVYMSGTAAIKAGLFEFTTDRRGAVQRSVSPYRFAWARVDGVAFTAPQKPEHVIASDDEGFVLFAMPFAEGIEVFVSAAAGQRLWLGFKTKGGHERVLSGHVKWAAGAEEQFRECLDQMSEAASSGASR